MKNRNWTRKPKQKAKYALRAISRPARRIWPRPSEAVVGTVAIGITVFALLTYSTTLAHYASQLVRGNPYLAFVDGMLNPLRNRNLLLKSDLPVYDLSVDHSAYATLEQSAAAARRAGRMSDQMQQWVSARFYHGGEQYNVKLRLRGDLPAHWSGPKKSWRIRFGNQPIDEHGESVEAPIYFRGRRQINLIVPNDRDYVLAPVINELMREEGLTVPDDRFVILRMNGRLQGLYYEVEQLDGSLLALGNRPETTIFGQNGRAMHFEQYTKLGTAVATGTSLDLGSLARDVDEQGFLGLRAMQVLMDHSLAPTPERFARARAVLDWEKYLHFRNVTTLCCTNHVRFGSDNLKLYYDASVGLLEPIPWDVHLTRMPIEPGTIDFWNSHGPDQLQRSTLLDPQQRLRRNRLLWKWVQDGGERLIGRFRKWHERIRPLAWADVLATPIQGYKMDVHLKNFEHNVRRVHKVLSHSSANLVCRLLADNLAALELTVTNFSGIHVTDLQINSPQLDGTYELYEDADCNGQLDPDDPLIVRGSASAGELSFSLNRDILPDVRFDADFLGAGYWEFCAPVARRVRLFVVGRLASPDRGPLDWFAPTIRVAAVNAVTGRPLECGQPEQRILPPDNSVSVLTCDASHTYDLDAVGTGLDDFLKAHPQFVRSSQQAEAVELTGPVTLAKTVIVPESVPLIVQPGADITLQPGVSLVAYGGVTAAGTPEQPIRIHGDGSGRPWGTFAALRPRQPVVLKYVDVAEGGQAQVNGVLFTGGLAVHQGDLNLDACHIHDMRSEDGINLKNGRIIMTHCVVERADSDGIDIDFGTGEVRNCRFQNLAGDGVDMSGSRITAAGNTFVRAGDKGVSVGENSHPVLFNNLFHGCEIGVSCKDLSVARVAHSTFVGNRLAIEAKRKKPFFGGGSGLFVNCVFANNDRVLQEDYFSQGKVQLRRCVLDQPVPISDCMTATIEFRSRGGDDFRLAETTLRQLTVPLEGEPWFPEPEGDTPAPTFGILDHLP